MLRCPEVRWFVSVHVLAVLRSTSPEVRWFVSVHVLAVLRSTSPEVSWFVSVHVLAVLRYKIAGWTRLWLFLGFFGAACASAEKVRAALCRLCRS